MKQHGFLLLTWSRLLFITECYADCNMYFLFHVKSHRSKLSIEIYYELFDPSGECVMCILIQVLPPSNAYTDGSEKSWGLNPGFPRFSS